MKLSDVRPCDNCQKPLAPNGVFYVLRLSQAMVDATAYSQQVGLSMMLGGSLGLAEVMGPDPDVIKVLGAQNPALWTEALICYDCVLRNHSVDLAQVLERAQAAARRREGGA